MSDGVSDTTARPRSLSPTLAYVAVAFALLGAASVAMIGVTSFTSFDPPDWLRIASMAPLPVVLLISVGCGIAALARSAGRVWGALALALDGLSLAAFVVMISVGG